MNGKKIISSLYYPEMRHRLVWSMRELSDKEYQLKNWTSPAHKHLFWYSMRYPLNFLFDEIPYREYPEDQIGYTLYNKEELKVVLAVIAAFERVLKEVGMQQPDPAYLTSPLWDELIKVSKVAYDLLKKNDELMKQKEEVGKK